MRPSAGGRLSGSIPSNKLALWRLCWSKPASTHVASSPCAIGIRSTTEAIARVRPAQCDKIVLLPLYPQYSSTTTGSSLNEWDRLFEDDLPVCSVLNFYRHELYLDSLIEKIEEALEAISSP